MYAVFFHSKRIQKVIIIYLEERRRKKIWEERENGTNGDAMHTWNMLIAIDTFASRAASTEYTHVHLWFVVRERE